MLVQAGNFTYRKVMSSNNIQSYKHREEIKYNIKRFPSIFGN
jgi:hypothetical protein